MYFNKELTDKLNKAAEATKQRSQRLEALKNR